MGMFSSLGGLFGGSGGAPSMQAPNMAPEAQRASAQTQNALLDPALQGRINQYGMGQSSLQDFMGNSLNVGAGQTQAMVENPFAGQRLASDQVANDQLQKGLYGQGGLMGQATQQATDLQKQGYTLKPEDYDAYGQAAGNIARQSGAQEGALSQALAARGLGGAQSGAAGQAFSNQFGNKFEQLGQMQQQIADTRMQRNQQMLNDARNYAAKLGAQGNTAEQQTRSANLAGIGQQQENTQATRKNDISSFSATADAQQKAAEFNAKNANPTLGDFLTAGIGQGIQSGAQGLPGAALGGLKSIFSGGGTITQGNQAGSGGPASSAAQAGRMLA
jgi:hypothetical protein